VLDPHGSGFRFRAVGAYVPREEVALTQHPPAIRARGLTRRFGAVRAVDGVDLEVPRGALFALIGPNGAGKSTTVRLLSGLLPRDGGALRVLGCDPEPDRVSLAARIGIVPDFPVLYDVLTARENVLRLAAVRGIPRSEAEARLGELAHALGMGDELDAPVHTLSTGTRKKASLASAMIHAPALLFLDEPFEGIDPVAAHRIRLMLGELRARGTTVFVTSHVLPLMEAIASDVAILHEGRLLLSGALPDLVGADRSLEQVLLDRVGAVERVPDLGWYRP
jgi:ABC-2 type transport system ATP-binding protein